MLTPFAIEIRKLRLDRGLKLVEMADRLGFSAAYLSAVETGRKPIPADLVDKINVTFQLDAVAYYRLTEAAARSADKLLMKQLPAAERHAVVGLARTLPQLTDEARKAAVEEIEEILKRLLEEKKG